MRDEISDYFKCKIPNLRPIKLASRAKTKRTWKKKESGWPGLKSNKTVFYFQARK